MPNRDAKVGLIVLGFVALGILLAVESFRTHPRFILIMIVIGLIISFAPALFWTLAWFLRRRGKDR
jgi:predicted permease